MHIARIIWCDDFPLINLFLINPVKLVHIKLQQLSFGFQGNFVIAFGIKSKCAYACPFTLNTEGYREVYDGITFI